MSELAVNHEYKPGNTRQEPEALVNFVEQQNTEIDRMTIELLKLTLQQYPHLSHVEIKFVPPDDRIDTGGTFDQIKIDEDTFLPIIFIVSKDAKHIEKIMQTRKESAKRVAEMLGIKFEDLTPELLRQFIIAHEFGHADDYVKNYEQNPEYKGGQITEEWNLHYEANLYSMPVPGYDPVDLKNEIENFTNLEDFLKVHPETTATVEADNIKSLEDLMIAQENAYRSSTYENYADQFATHFLKQNAKTLGNEDRLLP